ncbi:MAG: fibro-slime domain-containing protein [Clostridia bacterium]|nr:fibro-slime domain-containing protein [Clostridia bacterium]
MKKHSIGSKMLSTLLVLAMTLSILPVGVFAAVGDLSNVSTGLTGDIDTGDTISLPIKILDYEADGMLFEYAEAYAGKTGVAAAKTAGDFGATWYEDYTIRTSIGGSVNTGNYWDNVTLALKTGTYANYTRMTWAGDTTANWTGNRAGVVMADFGESSTYTTDQVRYMVVVFRSNVRSGNFTVGLNRANLNGAGTSGNYTGNIAVTTENNTNWTYAVLDLKTGTLGSNWSKGAVYGVYVGLPIDDSGEWMDLAHVAFFSDKDLATAFGEYALTDGSDRGDNRGFGLLRSSRNQSGGNNYASIVDETTTVEQLNTYSTSATAVDFSTIKTLGYTLLGTFGLKGIANVGLLESGLSEEGYPVYKQEVVTYVANLLEHSLKISERTSDGWKNYRYVKGTTSSVYGGTDLATALRTRINGNKGSYAAASGKDLVGTWEEVQRNIATYYDAAYFILNSIFVPGSYNVEKKDYNYLVLSAGTDTESGDKVYVFDGGFATSSTPASAQMAIDYKTTDHTIQNTSAAGKAHFVYEGTSTTTLNPFLPITDRNTASGMTKSPYYQDDGVINSVKKQTTKDTLYQRNFGFAMVSEGEFVYHADDELFFEFEGDDDVYLFINNELVMDIGSAHSIDIVRFELNDYVNAAKAGTLGSAERNEALALEEGETYPFKFYYMERHSYGSNIRICTNIRVTDPSMLTAKPAWQDGVQLDFGSVVDKDKVVEYGFAITNNGEENLHNLTFTDNDIGVTLDPTNGLKVTGSRVYDVSGGTLEASDLTAVVTHPDYADINVTFADNNALKMFLTDLAASGTEAGGGLFIGATVQIRGIGYKLSDAQIAAGVFDNTVLTTSTNATGTKTLQGQATMRVFVPADPMYYEWAGHELKVTKTKLIEDVLVAANQADNILNGKVPNLTTSNVNKIELVTKAGTAISSPYVTIDGSNNLTINYPTAGSKVFYVKVTYNSSKTVIVPVLVNVTDVQDSVIVLDYGLPVDLTSQNSEGKVELTKNDALTVPGRNTEYRILGIGSAGAYENNEITFTLETDGVIEGKFGTFKLEGQKLTYTPDKFIENVDQVQIAYTVYESDITPSKIAGTLDINNEVEMYKTINILPANVMYYEDDFNVIKYGDPENTSEDGSSKDLMQSADQSDEYGSDPAYADITDPHMYSADSVRKIKLTDYAKDIVSFTFVGTGFELIAQTNASDAGTIVVNDEYEKATAPELEVSVQSVPVATGYAMGGESLFSGANTRIYPVIMEFDNGNNSGTEAVTEAVYEVPVIRIEDLDYMEHTVTIHGVPAYTYNEDGSKTARETYLYFDGLRIFKPVADSADNWYDADERDAQFKEIRDLILTGNIGAASRIETGEGANYTIGSAKNVVTWTENYENESNNDDTLTQEEIAVNQVAEIDDYLLKGPNNEVYMLDDTVSGVKSALFFAVDKASMDNNPNAQVQIAVRALDLNKFFGAGNSQLNAKIWSSALDANGSQGWKELATVKSGTEQYYEIDVRSCPQINNNNYFVALKIDGTAYGMVSYSSLKLTGGAELAPWEMGISTEGEFINGIYDSGESGYKLESSGNSNSVANLISAQLRSDLVVTEPVNRFPTAPSIPEIDDPFQNLPDVNDPDTNPDDPNDPETDTPEEEDKAKPSNFDLLKLFTLTAIAGEGGTITPEGDLIIAFGASRTFKFIPDEGYEIADVLVNGKSVGAVEKYVLKAAHADTVVEVLFREIPEAAADEEAAAEEAAG